MADQPDMTDQISISMGHELVLSREILNQVREAGDFSVRPSPASHASPLRRTHHAISEDKLVDAGADQRWETAPDVIYRSIRTAAVLAWMVFEVQFSPILQATDFQLDGVFAVTEHGAHSLQPVPVRAGLEWRMYGTPEIGSKWRQVTNPPEACHFPSSSKVMPSSAFCRYLWMPTMFLRGSSTRACRPCRSE